MSKKLTEKQKMFCREYIKDFNATQAAIRAGYSKNGAGQSAQNLLKNTYIQQRIQRAIEKRNKRNDISADRVLQEYIRIGLANPNDFYHDENGKPKLKSWDSIKKGAKAAISEIDVTETIQTTQNGEIVTSRIKLKTWNKIQALKDLALHTGLFSDNKNDDDSSEPPTIIFNLG